MKAFVLACVALVAISFGANYALHEVGMFSAETQGSGTAVRLD